MIGMNKRQQGASAITVLLGIALVLFFGLVLVRLVPVYSDHWYLSSLTEELASKVTVEELSLFDVRERLDKNLQINNIQFDSKQGIKFDNNANPNRLVVNYEKRVDLFFNLDIVATFNDEYPLQR
jgi:hypothetical protein